MAKLNTHVHVHDKHGKPHVFGPGQDIPDWAQEKITNPRVWEEPPAGDSSPAGGGGRGKPLLSPPPKSGTGSGAKAWAEYAVAYGVSVPEKASREDIIELLQAAELPTEPAEE